MADKKAKNYTSVTFSVPGADSFTCGRIPDEKIYDYLKDLEGQNLNLQHCATYDFYFYNKSRKDLHHHILVIETIDESTYTYGIRPLCRAYTIGGCFRKIKNGTCKDQFVVEKVGKVFFPDKYKDANQR